MKPTDFEDLGVERWVSEGGSAVGVTRSRPAAARDPQYSTSGETDVPSASHRVGSVAGSPTVMPEAIALARSTNARITLLTVVREPMEWVAAGDFDLVTERAEHLRQLQASAQEVREAALAAVPPDVSVRESRCAGGCVDAGDLVPRRMGKYPSRPAPRPHALRK